VSAGNVGDQSSVGRIVKFLISFIPSQGQTEGEREREREREKERERERERERKIASQKSGKIKR